jgi:hypothetical protein
VRPFVINGELWGVARVPAGDPRLIDRTGGAKLAVTDSLDRTIYVRDDLVPPLLDRVMLHEVAHAITVSWGLLPKVRSDALRGDIIGVEEWAAQLVENHAMEAVQAARRALGRPICVRGLCSD